VHVLIAEDDPVSRHLLKATLSKWGYEVLVAEDGQQAWDVLQSGDSPNLVILDWMMPNLDGLELCRRVRDDDQGQYIYIILLTAKGTRENLVEGMEAGADDYIVKPFDSEELKVRLRSARRILELEAKLLSTQSELRRQASHDALTGLRNRGAILEEFERELVRARREQRPIGIGLVDVDKFKTINDTHGHSAGDMALIEVCNRMSHSLRPYDIVGRYGGDEFLIVLPGCDVETAGEMGERLRESVNRGDLSIGEVSFPVSISIGVASIRPDDDVDVKDAIHRADQVMFEAKTSGRNRAVAVG
jgi:diguanylate cyclase (GGDEF)-like protein